MFSLQTIFFSYICIEKFMRAPINDFEKIYKFYLSGFMGFPE